MPRIPTYTASATDEPIRGPRVPTDAPLSNFGGGQAAEGAMGAAAQLGGDVAAQASYERRKAYQDAVQIEGLRASNQIAAEELRIKKQLMTVKGRDAQQAAGKVGGDLEKFYTSLEKSIENPDVKQRAYAEYARSQQALDGWSNNYAASEMQQYEDNEFKSFMTTQRESAAVDPSPSNVAPAAEAQRRAIAEYAQRHGLGEEWVKGQQRDAASATYTNALKTILASGNDLAAKNFYDMNNDMFVGQDAIYAKGAVEQKSRVGEANRIVDGYFAGPKAPKTMSELQSQFEKIEDGTLRNMVESKAQGRLNDIRESEHIEYGNLMQDAIGAVRATGNLDRVPYGIKPSDMIKLDEMAARMKKGDLAESDPKVYTEFWAMSKPQLKAITEQDMLTKYYPKMTSAHYASAVKEWSEARENKAGAGFQSLKSNDELLISGLADAQLGGITKLDSEATIKKDEDKSTMYMKFRDEIDARRKKFLHDTGNNADDEQTQKFIDETALKFSQKVKLRGFGIGKYAFETEKFIMDLTEEDMQKPISGISKGILDRFHGLAKGNIPQNMTAEQLQATHPDRVNRAYLAALAGEGNKRIADILAGNR